MRTTKNTVRSSIESSRSTNSSATTPGAMALKGISDRKLLSSIRKLSERERKTVLSILVHLIEIDRRRLYLEMGYSSLFELCVKDLGYSESVAGRRISVARCISRFPPAFRALASGKVNLTSLGMITSIITAGNAGELLSKISGASKREIELLVNSRRPRSAIRDRVRPVYVRTEILLSDAGSDEKGEVRSSKSLDGRAATTPTGGSGRSPNSEDASGCSPCTGSGPAAVPDSGGRPAAAERRVVLEERFEVKFGADQEFIDKMERLRSLLSSKHHRHLEFAELFSVLMDEYIERRSPEGRIRRKEKREQRKAAEASKVQKTASQTAADGPVKQNRTPGVVTGAPEKKEDSRYIPRKVRDEVYARDKGRCVFVSPGGRRCGSKWDLQVDHIVPFARGGDNSPENLRLLCAKHNRLEAERAYGEKHMERYRKKDMEKYIKEGVEQYCPMKMEQYVKESKEQYGRKCMEQHVMEGEEQYGNRQMERCRHDPKSLMCTVRVVRCNSSKFFHK